MEGALAQRQGANAGENISWQALQPRQCRWRLLGQRPVIVWFTGLSGAGKSSIANAVDLALNRAGRASMVLDGDNLRHGLNKDLSFADTDRSENIRRTSEVAKLMAEAGLITLVSLISPFSKDRARARDIAGDIPFLEVYINTPLAICEARDPKGLYGRARAGEIANFTGISAPYEPPSTPDLVVTTQRTSVEASACHIVSSILTISKAD